MLTFVGLESNYTPLHSVQRVCTRSTGSQEVSPELRDYLDSVVKMTGATTEITGQNLFVAFYTTPDWYDEECKRNITALKTHANLWNDSLLPKLMSVPETIVRYNLLYKTNSKTIKRYTDILLDEEIDQEDREEAEQLLLESIESLIDGATQQKSLVDDVISQISSLLDAFNSDKTFTSDLCKNALSQKEINKKKVEGFGKDLEDLRKELEYYQNMVMGGEIGLGVSLTVVGVGIAGMLAGGPYMLVVFLIGVGGLIASVATMIAGNKKIAEKTGKIIDKQKEQGDAEKDVQYCVELEKGCTRVCTALENGIHALTGISSLWGKLQLSMTQLANTVQSEDQQAKGKLYEALQTSITSSDAMWKAIVSQAEVLSSIQIKSNTGTVHKMTVENGRTIVA